MISRYEISCVIRSQENNAPRITHIAGVNEFGDRWKLPVERAIVGIEDRNWDFYISKEGKQVNVIVEEHSGEKIMKTEIFGHVDHWDLPICTF